MLRRRCAWCRKVLDGKGPIEPGEQITDGVCKPCYLRVWAVATKQDAGRPVCQRRAGL